MLLKDLKQIEKKIKDLILFDSSWKKRKKTPKGIETYRMLARNNLNDILSIIYPSTKYLLQKNWVKVISSYIESFPPSSPILNKVGENFSKYLKTRKDILKKYPFISELAEYEWIEVEIYEKEETRELENWPPVARFAREARRASLASGGKIGKTKTNLVINPIHKICNFEYPVPEIIEKLQRVKKLEKIKKQPVSVFAYRDPKDLSVRFLELSEGAYAYLQLLETGFQIEMVPALLEYHYNIDGSNQKRFHKDINNLVKSLKKSRILIPQTS